MDREGPPREVIDWEDFERVDVRSGTIVKVEPFPRARNPSYKVWVDFGPDIGVLTTSAQVTVRYTPEVLVGRGVAGCVNLGEKNIGGFRSQFLLLGFQDENDDICLITIDPKVPNGKKMY